jgi:hypothetical protein
MLTEGILYHPSSVRIKKAYALESARQGLESYASRALDELRTLISVRDHAELSRQVASLLAVER